MIDRHRFGRFEIIRRLSRSMTDVYLVHDPQFGRTVVLKIIEHANDESVRLAIEAESRGARIQQQLRKRSPQILEVYETGEQDGCFFVALEYFPGGTLAEILKAERQLSPKRAAGYAIAVCRQLRTLHGFTGDAGGQKTAIVHGDIKPSNIQIGVRDELRLLDFGIAKFIRPGHDLTRHQLGSPSYCSPERLRDSRVDVHADLWGLGVTLYEMLAGIPPFQAQDTRQLEKLIQARRPPLRLPDSCPAELRAIVAKALAGEQKQRYQTAETFEKELESYLTGGAKIDRASLLKANETATRAVPETHTSGGKSGASLPPPRRPAHDLSNVAIALLAGVLAGLVLFVSISYYSRLSGMRRVLSQNKNYASLPPSTLAEDWQLYQTIAHQSDWERALMPARPGVDAFHKSLLTSAESLIGKYRRSPGDQLAFNWSRVRVLLLYVREMDPNNRRAEGELHLCDGYLALQHSQLPNVPEAARDFRRAATLLAHSPDPHLALARVYASDLHNVGAALAEFQQAERRGYRLGARDHQQQADAYLFRAEYELNRAKQVSKSVKPDTADWLRQSRSDFEQARSLYEPIASYSHAGVRLERINADLDEQVKWETAVEAARPKPHMVLLKMRYLNRPGLSIAIAKRWR